VHQVGLGGTASGDAMPSNVSVPISFYALSGTVPPKRVRNGVSLAGISELLVVEGNLNVLGLGIVQAFANLIALPIVSTLGGDYKPIVRQEPIITVPPTYVFFDMQQVLMNTIISSAARRVQSTLA